MPACEHSPVCGREARDGHDGKCILHSEVPDKNQEAFEEALDEHREDREGDFRWMVFPSMADFWDATFEEAYFPDATFEEAYFRDATFNGGVSFSRAFETSDEIRLERADFSRSEFRGDVLFAGESEKDSAFAGGEVSFLDVGVASDAALKFRYADLSRCRFLRTDLRDLEFTGVKWCSEVSSDGRCFDEWFWRIGLYDEVYEQNQEDNSGEKQGDEGSSSPPWFEIERLYRQLKRNYEDRGDFPRAGNFHIGEKVARRQNPQTHWGACSLLTAYRALSKYGERALPAFLWLLFIVLACAGAYAANPCTEGCFEALRLSTQATFFPVQPIELEGPGVGWVNLFQRIVSPLILFLLALALRQRVKR